VTPVRVAGFDVEKLIGEAVFDGTRIVARLRGSASHREVEALGHFLGAALAEALRVMVTEIVLDLCEVAYMNSSHFKALVSWLGRVAKVEPRVHVKLRSNPAYHWQKRSLDALRHLADDLVTIE
jgi:hypothetical protein